MIDYISILEDFKNIKSNINKIELDFFSVSGYSHYENVISNILSFYLDSNEEHNMKDLWVASLISAYNKNSKKEVLDENFYDTNNIEREKQTDKGGRIDLYLEANDYHIIVENKIYHDLGNDLDDYNSTIFNKYKLDQSNMINIVLSLNKIENSLPVNFVNITYDDLFCEIKLKIGKYLPNINQKWFLFMTELMKNIEKLKGGQTMELNRELQEIYKDSEKEEKLQKLLDNVSNDFDAKAEFLKNVINEIKAKKNDDKIEVYNYRCRKGLIDDYMSAVIDIKINDNEIITIEPHIERAKHPNLLHLAIWNRTKMNYEENYKIIKDVIKDKYSIKEVDDIHGWGKTLLIKEYDFAEIDVDKENFVDEWLKLAENILAVFENKK